MIRNNLCEYCRHYNRDYGTFSDVICPKFSDFVVPTSNRVISCNFFECLPYAYSDVVYKHFVYPDKFVEIGLVAPRTFKRERNKNQYII